MEKARNIIWKHVAIIWFMTNEKQENMGAREQWKLVMDLQLNVYNIRGEKGSKGILPKNVVADEKATRSIS